MSTVVAQERVFKVPDYNLPKLQMRINQLNQSALKLGCKPITIKMVDTVEEKDEVGFIHKFYKLSIDGEAPKLQGWKFVATLTHAPEGNIIRTTPGESVPQEYYKAKPVCDYCKKDWIVRRDTYIVKNDKGEIRQIGSNCLSDFLGHPNPMSYAMMAEALAGLQGEVEVYEKEDTGAAHSPHFERLDTEDFLTYVAATIDKYGWVSGKEAYEDPSKTSTATEAYRQMEDPPRDTRDRVIINQQHRDEAKKTLEYIRKNVEPKNDYQHNLKTLATAKAFTVHEGKGFVASMIPYFRKEQEREVVRQKRAEIGKGSNYVGEEGERLYDIPVTILSEFTPKSEGPWGASTIYRMIDDQGNVYTWFASPSASANFNSSIRQDLKAPDVIGASVVISGTVKKHNEYKGRKETMLTRVKLEV